MASTVSALRASEGEFETWKGVAERLGEPFNRWARRALNEQADLDLALLTEREATGGEVDGAAG